MEKQLRMEAQSASPSAPGQLAFLADAAVLALTDKCRGITHANFGYCENLTDGAVIALVDKCPEITHADFTDCWKLTGAAAVLS